MKKPPRTPGQIVQRAVLGLVVDAAVELDAEVAIVAGGLNELACPRPDRGDAAADALAVRIADEVVIDVRTEVVRALDARQDVAVQDQIDAVVRVEAKRLERVVAVLRCRPDRSSESGRPRRNRRSPSRT